ncbi:Holliday junction branch migration protein RuvA [Caldisalinibacter kiritimatiensis]|uniref:Holliday junction branch migration complex subunit RuvA n=1 Tax=Caldisalinibacter kiritimatiensis TaxID=1304284 RepID=R1CEF4_9FIRM|nr:Holliday junction branch migration protein RuvA [Caldisalinibacter kiritimatiensis]EOD00675.1 Holliday junction DNA helicase RuvA [Caldisalinibacter kiritimatiensis]
MYKYIKGRVTEKGVDYIVIENNGIGYLIYTSKNSIMSMEDNVEESTIYTYLNVREDAITLYGFISKDEVDMFRLLMSVSGIGPKVALAILSTLSTNNIKLAIINDDIKALSKAPGIGKKTAKRIILELKDKIDNNIVIEENRVIENTNNIDEVIGALLSLGYTRNECNNVLAKINKENLKTEEIIKIALKELSKK